MALRIRHRRRRDYKRVRIDRGPPGSTITVQADCADDNHFTLSPVFETFFRFVGWTVTMEMSKRWSVSTWTHKTRDVQQKGHPYTCTASKLPGRFPVGRTKRNMKQMWEYSFNGVVLHFTREVCEGLVNKREKNVTHKHTHTKIIDIFLHS